MKHIISIFICSLFLVFKTNAQIIIVEAKNLTDTVKGLEGNVDLNFNFNSNTNQTISGGGGSEIKYLWKRNRIISLNNYNAILNIDEAKNAAVNQGYQHLRFSQDINYVLTLSYFAQIQTNPVLRIKTRILNGVGPRFNLQPYGKNSLLIGSMIMHEYEEELDTAVFHNDIRASIFVFYKMNIAENLMINSVTYFQPRLDYFEDYRLSSTLDMTFFISQKINWRVSFNLLYDAFPVFDPRIPNLTYSFRNGLSYRF